MKLFGIDSRSLAVFRIAMGLLLLADLAIRAGDLHAIYTDDGMFSRAEIARRVTTHWNWSIHFAGGEAGAQAWLFGVAALCAVALAAGFETRLATIGSWILLVSLHHRVPPILGGADILFRMLLFWGMFLPLGHAWSLDAWGRKRRGEAEPPATIVSISSAAILLQMGLMYLMSAIFKSNLEWFKGGVIAGSLAHDFYAKPLGASLLNFPAALSVMTWGVFLLEWAGPILLFWPKRTARTRMIAVSLLAAMHLGIALTLNVDLFSWVSITGLALFLPKEFWNSAPLQKLGFTRAVAPISGKPATPRGYAAQGICLLALVYVIAINLNGLARTSAARPGPLRTGLGLGQKWNMFDETPSRDGWYVARAKLRDGTEVDLLRPKAPLNWERPRNPGAIYPNFRWRKLFREMAYEDQFGYQLFRRPVAEFLCREWNQRQPPGRHVREFEFIFCAEAQEEMESGRKTITREPLLRLHFDRDDT